MAAFFRPLKKAHLRCCSSGYLLAYASTRRGATLIAPSIWTFLNGLGTWLFSNENRNNKVYQQTEKSSPMAAFLFILGEVHCR